MDQSLFDQDYILWVQENVAKLKAKDFENLDLDNLIEEFESLIYVLKRDLDDDLTNLLVNMLKRLYVPLPNQFERWLSDISFYRCGIELIFRDAPSLKEDWDKRFDFNYSSALYALTADYPDINFPEAWEFERDIESIDLLQNQKHVRFISFLSELKLSDEIRSQSKSISDRI